MLETKNRNAALVNYQMTISHEFRTPLTTSLMFLESLMVEKLSKSGEKLLKLIIMQINLLLCLVNDILDFKLIEENKFIKKQEIFSPKSTFEFITNMFNPQAKMQNTSIEFQVLPSLIARASSDDLLLPVSGVDPRIREEQFPDFLVGDQIRLKQVLINLTKNALKFTVEGNIKIVAAYDYASEQLKVHVIDTGKGITQDEMKKVFEQFGKVERTSALNLEGIGVGLNICQKIVKHCDGEIRVVSDGQDQGSTFMFSMKMHELKNVPEIQRPGQSASSQMNNRINLEAARESSQIVEQHARES